MALTIKQIQSFYLTVLRIAGFLEYLQQFVKLILVTLTMEVPSLPLVILTIP